MGEGRIGKTGKDGVKDCLNLKQMTSAVSRCALGLAPPEAVTFGRVVSGSMGASLSGAMAKKQLTYARRATVCCRQNHIVCVGTGNAHGQINALTSRSLA